MIFLDQNVKILPFTITLNDSGLVEQSKQLFIMLELVKKLMVKFDHGNGNAPKTWKDEVFVKFLIIIFF